MKRYIAFILSFVMMAMLLTGCASKKYVVTFDANGGSKVAGIMMQEVEEGHTAIAPTVDREGYIFDGWDKSFENVTSNLTIKAKWIKQVTVTFDPADGLIVSGNPVQILNAGEMPEEPTVSREGFEFAGWDTKIKAVSEEDVTYTATWREKVYTAEEIYDKLSESVVEITVYGFDGSPLALGTGFFIDDTGTMVTNYHVIEGAYSADVTFYSGAVYDVDKVIGFDPDLDLALIHVAVASSIPVPISDREVKTGETVYCLGSSEGLTGTFSEGIVSNVSRMISGKDCIQITAPISHGNSGGPCVNEYCEVIGINSMVYAEGQNLNFAIKIHEIEKLDQSNPMTVAQVYEYMGYSTYVATYASVYGGEGHYTIVDNGDEGVYVYDDADYVEWEENDSLDYADILVSGFWTGAYINIAEDDIDLYLINVTDPNDFVSVYILPYWAVDAEEIVAFLFQEVNGELEVVAEFTVKTTDSGTVYLYCEASNVAVGNLYVYVSTPDDYDYVSGPYYEIMAMWGV